MQALWLEEQTLSLRSDLPTPEPHAQEALVRVLCAGICNTDMELLRGYYPYRGILGHEFVGVVEQGPTALLGQRVVGEINAYCGHCQFCRRGMTSHCEQRTVLGIVNRHGAFASYLTLPHRNLHPVPDTVATAAATFTEPLAAALEILEQVTVERGDRVLVVGDGKLGLLIAQVLALTGCDLFVAGRHPQKLAILDRRGIDTGPVTQVHPRTYDIAVDCTGNPQGFDLARQALRPRGTLVLKSTYAGKLSLDASALVVDEITVVGSRCGPFQKALQVLEQNQVDVSALIQATYPLHQGLEAFRKAQERGVLKVLLEIST
ncbi:MDR/zinc-dependent alcohol dehydrogenase-like family protein [Lyngbya confervoides]|uniref:Alcohol dehydrogenase catalytic domain-containing protein n=1 Tax=Lyngbya confervoides BDU141951 TaxID=1574623 RepID=A0ABD4T1F7_9CYAN|nr:alcohol dehydrogenase catalytic domain-containing protein [Lyngbya confervoides]MCM1982430.1 alcohol dehydrogenase catalytic domain-containing protein [Lyngbya confervoides BDU141951]